MMTARRTLLSASTAVLALGGDAAAAPFSISVDGPATVGLGRVVRVVVDASAFPPSPGGTIFWPFVNGTQWGACNS